MVKKCDKAAWKANYFLKLQRLIAEYPKCFLVSVDNVGSLQMQQIRESLRGTAEILMGKNTMIRKVLRGAAVENPSLEKLIPHIVENVGFVFTREDLSEVKELILSNRVAAPAKFVEWGTREMWQYMIVETAGEVRIGGKIESVWVKYPSMEKIKMCQSIRKTRLNKNANLATL